MATALFESRLDHGGPMIPAKPNLPTLQGGGDWYELVRLSEDIFYHPSRLNASEFVMMGSYGLMSNGIVSIDYLHYVDNQEEQNTQRLFTIAEGIGTASLHTLKIDTKYGILADELGNRPTPEEAAAQVYRVIGYLTSTTPGLPGQATNIATNQWQQESA